MGWGWSRPEEAEMKMFITCPLFGVRQPALAWQSRCAIGTMGKSLGTFGALKPLCS